MKESCFNPVTYFAEQFEAGVENFFGADGVFMFGRGFNKQDVVRILEGYGIEDKKLVSMVLKANCGNKCTKAFKRLNRIVKDECLQEDPEAMRYLEEGGEDSLDEYRLGYEMPDSALERVNMIAERLQIGGTGEYGFHPE